MLFNSLEYLLFFPLVGLLYFAVPHRLRWGVLLLASYGFYMYWKPAYALLLLASTAVDYFAALRMEASGQPGRRKFYLGLSLAVNLGFLIGFKYLGLLNEAVRTLVGLAGGQYGAPELDILLPIGISFYTFQTLSYTIDVYRGNTKAEKHFGIFALYVSFFPQLVSGPIERSSTLLPQLRKEQKLDFQNLGDGLKLIVWGLFQKVVMADRLAVYVDQVFQQPENYTGAPVLLSVYFFAFQVFFDFAGYTNIAIGSAKCLGFELSENFDRPYLAKSVPEFWRRWHISLTTWFRDYVYFPLGGGKAKPLRKLLNVYIVFFLVAMWHGADGKLAIFATMHFIFYLATVGSEGVRRRFLEKFKCENNFFLTKALPVFITFNLVAFTWVMWWARSLSDVWTIYRNALLPEHYSLSGISILADVSFVLMIFVLLCFCQIIYVLQGDNKERKFMNHKKRGLRWLILYLLLASIVFLRPENIARDFIYFQF